MFRSASLVILILLSLLLVGCGSSNMSTSTTAPTTTTNPPPTGGTGGSGGSSGGSGSGGTSSAPDNYFATQLLESGASRTPTGQIMLDVSADDGTGNAHGMVGPSTSQKLQFCPYLGNYSNCFDVASFTSDATGGFNVNFTFPKKGAQLGLFRTVTAAGAETSEFAIGSVTQTTAPSFQAALLPASLVSGGVGTTAGAASLQQGTVAVVGSTGANSVIITLKGAPPNDTFTPKLCLLDGVRCGILSAFTTDSSGNATVTLGTTFADSFVVVLIADNQGVEYVGAFRVN